MLELAGTPEKGTIYALYTDKVVYIPDTVVGNEIEDRNLLELHIFDSDREFRFIKSQRGNIRRIIDDQTCKHDDVYEETVFTANGAKVTVINYICYDAKDFLNICNYRLKEAR